MKDDWNMGEVERSLKFVALEKEEKQQQANAAAERMAARRAIAFRFIGGGKGGWPTSRNGNEFTEGGEEKC